MGGRVRWRRPLLWAIVVTVLWLGLGGPLGSFQGRLAKVQDNDNTAFLPTTAKATRVAELAERIAGQLAAEPGQAVGVLIDTLIVRSLLVPGLCHDLGDRIWWPGRLARRAGQVAAPSEAPADVAT